jgi:hypothetical protein
MLLQYGRPVTSPPKVKVIPGSSPSQTRRALGTVRELGTEEVDERRDYAHYVYRRRLEKLALEHRDDVRKIYLPYLAAGALSESPERPTQTAQ